MMAAAWTDEVRAQYAARGLGGRLTPRGRSGLVVVDLIRGFTDPACAPGCPLDAVVCGTATLVDAARTTGAFIAYTTIAFPPDRLDDIVWLRKMPAMRVLTIGSRWVELDPRLDRREDEPLVVKQAASAFTGTDLAAILREQRVGTVIVCGATTSGCVRATTIDACAYGWPTFVPRACVGDRAIGPHVANLLDIDAKYGDVVSLDHALDILRSTAAIED